jgi:hypothetical protein
MEMAPLRATLGLLLCAAALSAGGARAQDAFDDPSAPGSEPCIVLNRFEVTPLATANGPGHYRADAVIENVCARAMEVHFCFLRAQAADGNDRSCFQGPLRPWAMASVADDNVPTRVTSPEYQWRYLQP